MEGYNAKYKGKQRRDNMEGVRKEALRYDTVVACLPGDANLVSKDNVRNTKGGLDEWLTVMDPIYMTSAQR